MESKKSVSLEDTSFTILSDPTLIPLANSTSLGASRDTSDGSRPRGRDVGSSNSPHPELWDPELTRRGVWIEPAVVNPGQSYWRVKSGNWLSKEEAQGRHHIFVKTMDQQGRRLYDVPFKVTDADRTYVFTASKRPPDDYSGDFPMSPSLRDYSIWVENGNPSEIVRGLGMGADENPGIHTATELEWELVRSAVVTPPVDPPPSSNVHLVFADDLSKFLASEEWGYLESACIQKTIELLREVGNRK